MENNSEKNTYINMIQFTIMVIAIICCIFIMKYPKDDYVSFDLLATLSLAISLIYLGLMGLAKSKSESNTNKAVHLKYVYVFIIIGSVIAFVLFCLFFTSYPNPKYNDMVSIIALAISMSTPYITGFLNKRL